MHAWCVCMYVHKCMRFPLCVDTHILGTWGWSFVDLPLFYWSSMTVTSRALARSNLLSHFVQRITHLCLWRVELQASHHTLLPSPQVPGVQTLVWSFCMCSKHCNHWAVSLVPLSSFVFFCFMRQGHAMYLWLPPLKMFLSQPPKYWLGLQVCTTVLGSAKHFVKTVWEFLKTVTVTRWLGHCRPRCMLKIMNGKKVTPFVIVKSRSNSDVHVLMNK